MQNQGYHPVTGRRDPQPTKRLKSRSKLCVFAGLAVIVALALLLIPGKQDEMRAVYDNSRRTFIDNVYVDGVALAGMTYNEAFDVIAQRISAWEKSWSLAISCNGHTYTTVDYGALGITLDGVQIDNLLQEAWAYGHTGDYDQFRRDVELLAKTPYEGHFTQSLGVGGQLDYILNVIQSSVYCAPQNAYIAAFDPSKPKDPFTFALPVNGHTIDTDQAKQDILARAESGEGGMYEVKLIEIAPEIDLEEVKKSVSLLAEATTAIDKHSTPERNENIALAFSVLSGQVLENGDRLSFNRIVGKRTLENGYKTALGYVSGELTETIGGGVCQASTTLYSAAVCAGMTIKERTPHYIPVSYISLGQDATVNDMRGHEIDLCFANETGGTVYITCGIVESASGRLQSAVYFYGQQPQDGAYRKLESVIVETLPIPEDVIRKDKEAKYVKYTNEKHKVSSGAEGYKVETYLLLCSAEGSVLERKLISKDTYRARGAIYYVGVTAPEAKE